MIFGKDELSCTFCTTSEFLPKSTEISAVWHSLYCSWLAQTYRRRDMTLMSLDSDIMPAINGISNVVATNTMIET